MENKDILNALQNYEMTFGTAENIFNGGLLTDAERDFVMRDSNAFLFGLIADQSVKAETAWSLPYKLAQAVRAFFHAEDCQRKLVGRNRHTATHKAGIASLSWQYGAVFVVGSRKTYIGIRRLRREYLGQCDCHGDRRAVGGVLWNQP